jgi:hypothetical protein
MAPPQIAEQHQVPQNPLKNIAKRANSPVNPSNLARVLWVEKDVTTINLYTSASSVFSRHIDSWLVTMQSQTAIRNPNPNTDKLKMYDMTMLTLELPRTSLTGPLSSPSPMLSQPQAAVCKLAAPPP